MHRSRKIKRCKCQNKSARLAKPSKKPKRSSSCPRPKTRRHPDDMPEGCKVQIRSKSLDYRTTEKLNRSKKNGFHSTKKSLKEDFVAKYQTRASFSFKANYSDRNHSEAKGEQFFKPTGKSHNTCTNGQICQQNSGNKYLQFLLKITEDIIKTDCYNNIDMKEIFLKHIRANQNTLSVEKMLTHLQGLMKELSMLSSDNEEESTNYWNTIRQLIKYDITRSVEPRVASPSDACPCASDASEREVTCLDYEAPKSCLHCSLDRLTEYTEPPPSSRTTSQTNVTSCSTFGNVDSLPGFEGLATPLQPATALQNSSTKITVSEKMKTCGHCSKLIRYKTKKSMRNVKRMRKFNTCKIKTCNNTKESIVSTKKKGIQTVADFGSNTVNDSTLATLCGVNEERSNTYHITSSISLQPEFIHSGISYVLINGPLYLDKRFLEPPRSIMAPLEGCNCCEAAKSRNRNGLNGREQTLRDSDQQEGVASLAKFSLSLFYPSKYVQTETPEVSLAEVATLCSLNATPPTTDVSTSTYVTPFETFAEVTDSKLKLEASEEFNGNDVISSPDVIRESEAAMYEVVEREQNKSDVAPWEQLENENLNISNEPSWKASDHAEEDQLTELSDANDSKLKERRVSILKNPTYAPKIDRPDEDRPKKGESIIKTVEVIKGRQAAKERDDKLVGISILRELESARENRAQERSEAAARQPRVIERASAQTNESSVASILKSSNATSPPPPPRPLVRNLLDRDTADELVVDYDASSYEELPLLNLVKGLETSERREIQRSPIPSSQSSVLASQHKDFLPELDESPELSATLSDTRHIDTITAKLDQLRRADDNDGNTEISATLNRLVGTLKRQQEADEQVRCDVDEAVAETTGRDGAASTSTQAKDASCFRWLLRRRPTAVGKRSAAQSRIALPPTRADFSEEEYKQRSHQIEMALANFGQSESLNEKTSKFTKRTTSENNTIIHDTKRQSLVRIADAKEQNNNSLQEEDTLK